jgi:arylsulfatase A-like enzyme
MDGLITEAATHRTIVERRFLLRFAVWMALAFGLAEAALVALVTFGLGRFMHVSPQLVWQAPLSFALVFLGLTAVVLLPWPRLDGERRLRLIGFACVFVGCASSLTMASQLGRTAVWLLAAGLAVQLSYLAVRFAPHLRRVMGWTLRPGLIAVAALGLGLNSAGWLAQRRQSTASAASPGTPNVVLIIWDTVRAASLSLYGYERETTPNLERLAGESVVFDNAFSPAPWTLPSHAAMFTGVHPDRLSADWLEPLDDHVATLAEVLGQRGYRTGGFVANTYFAGRESGLSRGFAHYDDFPILSVQQLVRSTALGRRIIRAPRLVKAFDLDPSMELKPARTVTDEALDWITARRDRPFFAFLNYLDAHSPYSPPAKYATKFGTRTRDERLNFGDGRRLTPDELQAEVDAYDAAIAYLDDELNRLIVALDSAGILEHTVLVVTSDHGEEFGEHDVYLHGSTLYDRSLHVPLVIRAPFSSGSTRRGEWVSLRDLPSTILALARIEGSPLPGEPLPVATLPDDTTRLERDTMTASVSRRPGVPARYPAARGRIVAVMMDPWKYIRGGNGAEELFDLRADRDERTNLIGTASPDVLAVLRERADGSRRLAQH